MKKKVLYNQEIVKRWYHNFIVLPILLFAILIIAQLVGEIFAMSLPLNEPYNTAIYMLTIGFGVLILLVFALTKYGDKRDVFSVGLKSKNFFKHYMLGFIMGVILFSLIVLSAAVLGGLKIEFNNSFTTNTFIGILIMLFGFTIQGSAEEILTRGYMMQVFSSRYSLVYGVIFSSFYFGILHSFNPGLTFLPKLNLVLFGLFAALLAVYKNQIITVCGLHVSWNWVQGHIFGVSVSGLKISESTVLKSMQVSGKDLISGGAFGIEGSIICTIVFTLGIIYYWYKIRTVVRV